MKIITKLRAAKLAAKHDAIVETARAVLVAPLVAIAADGLLSKREQEHLVADCIDNPTFRSLGPERTGELIKDVLDQFKRAGAAPMVKRAVEQLSPEMRETSICMAMRVAMADGPLKQVEIDVLAGIARRLGMGAETFAASYQVMEALQRDVAA